MNQQQKGIVYLAVCAVLWSTAGVLIKIIPWHSLVIGAVRSGIAALVLWVFLCKEGSPRPVINAATLRTGLMLGLCCSLFVAATKLTTAANAIVLQSANPVFVILFCALLYRQRFSRRDLIVVVVVMMGVGLFFFDELSPGSLLGNVLALLSAVTLAGAFIGATGASSLAETLSGVFLGHCLTALIGLPFFFIEPPVLDVVSVAAIVFLGVFQLGIPYVLFSYAARSCPPLAISLVGMLEPIFNPVWVAIFLHEIPGPLALMGGGVVIVTLCLWCVGNVGQTTAASTPTAEYRTGPTA